jgi:uncharacterized protein YjbI with pentapeptide repeats
MSIEVFISYSHKDDKLRQELLKHLNLLKRQNLITDWHDRRLLPGSEWGQQIDEHINTAKIILLLISADFLNSDYCYNIEMQQALKRHKDGEARVIPIIIREVDWRGAPFAKLQALPTDGMPVTSSRWKNRDEAFTNIAKGIRNAIEGFKSQEKPFQRTQTKIAKGKESKRQNKSHISSLIEVPSNLATMTSKNAYTFEDEIANLYQLLGFHTYRDSSICNKPTQMICEQMIRGGPTIRLFVECKNTKGKLTASTINQFLYKYRAIPEGFRITGGVIVTQHPPHHEIREELDSYRCRILSYEELLDDLLNVSAALRAYAAWYERQEIHLSYLPLKCITRPPHMQKGEKREIDVIKEVQHWLQNPERLFVILGDFGTGKTTILQRLKYEFASCYYAGVKGPIPVYIPLRNYESIGALEKFIEVQLQNELDVRIPFNRLLEFLRQGKLLLLLDGFDEMGQQIDKEKRRSNFAELLPLLIASPKNILTCRPAYFLTDAELDSVLAGLSQYILPASQSKLSISTKQRHRDFLSAVEKWNLGDRNTSNSLAGVRSVQLCGFSERDIDRYVLNFKKRMGDETESSVSDLRERIRRTYDLEDLARRPVLLNMIVQTVPSLPSDKEASPSVIYEAYTNSWMNHDYAKGQVRMLVPASEKRKFMQTLAWQMYSDGVVQMHYTKLTPHLSRFFRAENRMAEFISTDIQACSFLERDQGGTFRFSHKSFLEYFAAEFLRDQIKTGVFPELDRSPLSNEVCFFLGDMVHADGSLTSQFQQYLLAMLNKPERQEHKQRSANFLSIFSKSRISLSALSVRRKTWSNTLFRDNSFSGKIIEPEWSNITYEKCAMNDLKIEDLQGTNVSFLEGKMRNVSLINIREPNAGSPGRFSLSIRNSRLDNVKVQDKSWIEISGSELKAIDFRASEGEMRLENNSIDHSDIEQSLADPTFVNLRINYCTLSGASPYAGSVAEFLGIVKKRWGRIKKSPKKSLVSTKTYEIVETLIAKGIEPKESNLAIWKNSIFTHCLFTWWDFAQVDIEACKFRNCWFLACRFRDEQQLQVIHETTMSGCRFSVLCLLNAEKEEAEEAQGQTSKEISKKSHVPLNRTSKILFDSFSGQSAQYRMPFSVESLRETRFYREPKIAVSNNPLDIETLKRLVVPRTVEDLLVN